jgi:epoxyqueuosine reductase
MLCVGLLYNTDRPYSSELPGQPWVSRYAWGQDYHEVLGERLERLQASLKSAFGEGTRTRAYVDTGPVSEKAWASAAGLGWIGKNSCLIHPKLGSWLFLAEVLTDLDLEADPPAADLCGNCRKCLDVCPTQAFPRPYVLDAKLCLSYQSIEQRGEIAPPLQAALGNNLYGCDLCQDVCPWNHWKVTTPDPAFQPRSGNWDPDLKGLAEMTAEEFSKVFKGSPMKRTKVEGLRRNARIVLKNRGGEGKKGRGEETLDPPFSPCSPLPLGKYPCK